MAIEPQQLASEFADRVNDTLFQKITWRLMPILFISYIVAYIDRVNVGFAKLQMVEDLHFSATVYGFGSGIFFLGFLLFEIPSNLILHRVGARPWLTRIMLTWGVISILTMFVRTANEFYIARFFLGVAEAGFLPGVVYYLAQWFPQDRQGRAISLLITAAAVGGILVGPLSGWIMNYFGSASGLHSWQWLFLLQGIPALVVAVLLWTLLPDDPRRVSWLSPDERQRLVVLVGDAQRHLPRKDKIREVLGETHVWLLALTLVALNLGIYAVIFWTPTIIKESGVSSYSNIGYISALPYLGSALAMLALGRSSDHFQERRWHVAATCVIGALGLVLTTLAVGPEIRIAGVIVATSAFIGSTPLVWAMAGNFMSGRAAATGLALINAVAALGGLVGPYAMGVATDLTGSTTTAVLAIAVVAVLGSCCVLKLPVPSARVRQ